MIDLTCCTLVSLIYDRDSHFMAQTVRMINYMRSLAKFRHAILFSACNVDRLVDAEVVQIPPTDLAGIQIFQIKVLPHFIRTPFMCMCHDDGMIVDPEKWTFAFLHYDFIGAPWGTGLVGNEGFSIQSQKMLWEKARLPYAEPTQSDEFVCVQSRQKMIETGIRFAPFELALSFSTETVGNDQPSLGYHGRTHSEVKHKLAWEKIEAFENPTTSQ